MKAWIESSALSAANSAWLEEWYELWLRDPQAVPEAWRDYFSSQGGNGQETAHSKVRNELREQANSDHLVRETLARSRLERLQMRVARLVEAHRLWGHQAATIDPLGRIGGTLPAALDPSDYGIAEADLDSAFKVDTPLCGGEAVPLKIMLERLRSVYCGSIGYELVHIDDLERRHYMRNAVESECYGQTLDNARRLKIYQGLVDAEGLERYLQTRYSGQKRFSLEGSEALIPLLQGLTEKSAGSGIKEMVIGMAHRGRLNVLVNVLGKNPADLFREFEGHRDEELMTGDVKYHQGFSADLKTHDGYLHVALAFNPSHLEIVAPVVEGSVRARQDRAGDRNGDLVLGVHIHGDAAFSGQGVVMETMNMSDSRGFSTKGAIHIVVNNQIGFTTSNVKDSRSTRYCTDVAKMINAPILHVNGDDPEALWRALSLSLDYRQKFKRSAVIDLFCYRRHGHNEADEPKATQPNMYSIISRLPGVRQLYGERLVRAGVLTEEEAAERIEDCRNRLERGQCMAPDISVDEERKERMAKIWRPHLGTDWRAPCDTSLPANRASELLEKLATPPEGFSLHPRIEKILGDRLAMARGTKPLDWGAAENLAYASLVAEGSAVRLTGQDSGRGTFFHRHAVLHEQKTGEAYIPLRQISPQQGTFLVIDSLLSEEAVLAFEYGYSTTAPRTLVLWEAQFGDFANGAQVVIDQFIASGEAKWGRFCGLVMLLPHGFEGQGPEHSSARLERYLQLCSLDNIQVATPTTPAQFFHLLRRQAKRSLRRPLVVMTPKSFLRHPLAVSPLQELSTGSFQPVIDDIDSPDVKSVKSLVLCAGKVYYDLLERRRELKLQKVAIARVEQLYPAPWTELERLIADYSEIDEVVWCQEEPRNQGAWRPMRHRLESVIQGRCPLRYAGRASSPSTAVGYASLHKLEQQNLVGEALGVAADAKANS